MNKSIVTSVFIALMVLSFSNASAAQSSEKQFLKDVSNYFSKYCAEIEMTQVSRSKKSGLWDSILVACDKGNIFEVKNYFNAKEDVNGYLKVITMDPDFSSALSKEEPQAGLRFTDQRTLSFEAITKAVDQKIFKLTQALPVDKKSDSDSQYRAFIKK